MPYRDRELGCEGADELPADATRGDLLKRGLDRITMATPYETFLAELKTIPWFANLGKPLPDQGIQRINEWKEWGGPETEPNEVFFQGLQLLRNNCEGRHRFQKKDLKKVWDDVYGQVVKAAAEPVPYDETEDAWHAPTAAVWDAAFTAACMALFLYVNDPLPVFLEEHWAWFKKGHWHCGFAKLDDAGQPSVPVVY